jgi:hypothetical protein
MSIIPNKPNKQTNNKKGMFFASFYHLGLQDTGRPIKYKCKVQVRKEKSKEKGKQTNKQRKSRKKRKEKKRKGK